MKNVIFILLCLLLSFCSLPCFAQTDQNVTMSTKQYMTLKNNNEKLRWKLNELELQLNLLQTPSAELTQQLAVAREKLQQSQKELQNVRISLTNVKVSQKKTEEYLQSLKVGMELQKQESEDREEVLTWQRNLLAVLACYFMVN